MKYLKKSIIVSSFIITFNICLIYLINRLINPMVNIDNQFILGICVSLIIDGSFLISSIALKKECLKNDLLIEKESLKITQTEITSAKFKSIGVTILLLLFYYFISNTNTINTYQLISSLVIPAITPYVCVLIFIETPYKINIYYKRLLLILYMTTCLTCILTFLV